MFKYALFILLFFISVKVECVFASPTDTTGINEILSRSMLLQNTNKDSSYFLAQNALAFSQKLQYKKGIGGALIRIGSILYTNGKNDTALNVIKQAFDIRTSINDSKGAAGACILLSYIYQSLGKKDSAFASLYEALRLNRQINDSIHIVQIYNSLGGLNSEYENHKEALENYLKAAELSEQMNYEEGKLFAYDGIGHHYFYAKDYTNALVYFRHIDTMSTQSGELGSNAQNLTNIGLCYDWLKNYPQAKIYFKKALDLYIKLDMTDDMALGYSNMGVLYKNLHQPDSAIYFLNQSLLLARKSSALHKVASCYNYLAESYALKKDFSKAYAYHVQFSILSDSLLSTEKVKQIAEMQTKYETENKEHQIALLHNQNKIKSTQRNFFIGGTILFLLLAGAIYIGLLKTGREKKKSEELLLNILPSEVAEELKKTGTSVAKQYNDVTVMFTDFVNFTGISEQMSPTELVQEINKNFTAFDAIVERHGLEKIKTIGDAYLAVCGLPNETKDHARQVVKAALEIQSSMAQNNGKFQLRIGIHSGPVVAGIVGVKKFAYDIWGDTVNTASRMESNSEAGKVNISEATYALVKEHFNCTYRGKIEAKNKGEVDMYFVS